jgi:exodeoxyribonuclease III
VFRIITANLNGIRAAARKGFFGWMDRQQPDIVCVQETKAQEHQLPPEAIDIPA